MDRSDERDRTDSPLPWGTAQGVGDDYRPGSVAFPDEAQDDDGDGSS